MAEREDVRKYKEQVYQEFKEEIDLISKASEKPIGDGTWQADIGVATDIFINFIENTEESIFVNVPRAKEQINVLRAKYDIK